MVLLQFNEGVLHGDQVSRESMLESQSAVRVMEPNIERSRIGGQTCVTAPYWLVLKFSYTSTSDALNGWWVVVGSSRCLAQAWIAEARG